MTLKKKILIGYGMALMLMGLVIGWAVINLVWLGNATNAILSENYRSILAAENMVDALERQDSAVLLLFLGDAEVGVAQFMESESVFLQWLARAKDNLTIPGEAELVQAIESDYTKYRQGFTSWSAWRSGVDGPSQPAGQKYQTSVYPLFAKVRTACVQLRHLNEETMYEANVRAGRVAERAIWSTLGVTASAMILALFFSLVLAERMVRPLRGLMEASRHLSTGDYSIKVQVETEDEVGRLAGEFNRMAAQLGRYNEMNIEKIIAEKNKGEAILASIEDGLVVFDTGLRATGVNPAARRMLNLELTETSGMNCGDILPGSIVCDLINKIVETGEQPELPEEERLVRFPGGNRPRTCSWALTPVWGRDRRLTGIVMLLRDVTRFKEVEQLKSDFIMAASHELRTPLTGLGMSIDLLREHAVNSLEDRDREMLEAAHEEVQRMKTLINDLLDMSKIEAGRIDLEFHRVSVKILFEHAVAVFKSQAEIKEVSLITELVGDLPPVRADANKITWVLTNLISNALRYVGQGGHIKLTANRNGPHVYLSVRDDGLGIPLEYQSKIFQKFIQVEGREGGGTGLGLAICKEIVRAHGGGIWVDSSPGQGSTFTFTLPVLEKE